MSEGSAPEDQRRCRNCEAPLAGEYCSQCGQRERGEDLHFFEAASDLIGDLFSWDSRIWRTLFPLLLRPGFLTAEFMAGRRARYVPPLRLYLIISFVLFLVLSVTTTIAVEQGRVVIDSGLDQAADPNGVVELGVVSLDVEGDSEEPAAAKVKAGAPYDSSTIEIGLSDEDSPGWLQRLDQRMEENASEVQGNPGQFIDELVEFLPQMMFLLLPLFAVLLRLCYLGSPYHYLQHLVFSLNYHSFAFLLYLIGVVAERFGSHFDGLLFPLLLIYLPVGLWRAYGSGVAGALGKSVLIYFSYGILLVGAFALASLLTLAKM